MSAKAISEQTGKELLYKYICTTSAIQNRFKSEKPERLHLKTNTFQELVLVRERDNTDKL